MRFIFKELEGTSENEQLRKKNLKKPELFKKKYWAIMKVTAVFNGLGAGHSKLCC